MKRDPLGVFFLLALVAGVAALAAVTRFPDSWWVDRLTRAVVIGPWIGRVAELYRESVAVERSSELEGGVEVVYEIDRRRNEARPTIRVEAGSILFADPSESSSRLATLPADNLELLDRREDWYRVVHGDDSGWVLIPVRGAPPPSRSPPLGSEPAPTLPVPSQSPDQDLLAAATELLGISAADQIPESRLGPYSLYTDVSDRGLLIYLSAVAAQVESAYIGRLGLEPLPGTLEAVVLFASEASYLRYLAEVPEAPQHSAPGVMRGGIVATYAGGRAWGEIASTLIHELTHLLNKRALGPALPPWLEEGLADDLAQSRVAGLRILPGTLGGSSVRSGSRTDYTGGLAAAIQVTRALDNGSLPALERLVELGWPEFQDAAQRSLRYGHSSFFVRSLFDSTDRELAAAFRDFLRDVSEGGAVTPEAFVTRLGRSWAALDAGFASFVRRQADAAGLPVAAASDSSSRQAREPSS